MNRHNIQQYYIVLSKIRVQWSQETTTKTKEIASVEATQCLPSLNCKSNLNNLFRHMAYKFICISEVTKSLRIYELRT